MPHRVRHVETLTPRFAACYRYTMSRKPHQTGILPIERIEQAIFLIRGQRVMLDADLANLYGVPTKRLNEQVKRNRSRFPRDFMFRLTPAEVDALDRSQFATGSQKHRSSHFRPYAFTEHGAIMAANVLNSQRAVRASVFVVRAFVKLRQLLSTHKELGRKLEELERKVEGHDEQIVALIEVIRQLMAPPPVPQKAPIGFRTESGG